MFHHRRALGAIRAPAVTIVANSWGTIGRITGAGALDGTKMIFTQVGTGSDVQTALSNLTGKKYLECTYAGTGVTKTTNGNASFTALLWHTSSAWPSTNRTVTNGDSLWDTNGVQGIYASSPIPNSGTTLAFAIDFGASKIWCGAGILGSGVTTWNQQASLSLQNPATGAGGHDFSAANDGTPYFFGVIPLGDAGDNITLNVGPSWGYVTLPSGYSGW